MNSNGINPLGIAKWLERECVQMGVEIKTGATVLAVCLTKENILEGLKCSSEGGDEDHFVPCQKLVLTAGPWTPALVKSLFPNTSIDLKPAINAGDWLVMENRNCLNANSLAVVFFDDIVHDKLEFAGRNDGTIWVCGRRNYTAKLPPLNTEDKPDETVISDLMKFSRRFFEAADEGKGIGHDPIILAQGRYFRPSTVSGLPIISKISSTFLFCSEKPHSSADSGVFVCYGHGSYGITLGIGSGKLISQLVRNQKTDIDISKFGLAQDQKMNRFEISVARSSINVFQYIGG
ncbi:hypothetical protein N7488_005250 [Penicillium malachiteum]|nr:hypothetical protein N7488_005250 [Penicillium malachiteum]